MQLFPGHLLVLLPPESAGTPSAWRVASASDVESCLTLLARAGGGHVVADEPTLAALGAGAAARLEALGPGTLLRLGSAARESLDANHEAFVVDALQEFRTPATVVLEFASLLADTAWIGTLNERQRDYVTRIRSAASGLCQRIADFRASLGLRAGAAAPDDRADVGGMLRRFAARACARQLLLTVEVPSGPVEVEAPTVQLERALEALVEWTLARPGNDPRDLALTVAEGVVEVRLTYAQPTPTAHDLRVLREGTVHDGVQRKSVTKLFGVGIELARATAVRLGGELTLEALEEGGGCFRLRLPEASARAQGRAA